MSIRDQKITDAQIREKGVIASPDTLTGTADENKSVFDRLVREIVAPQFNVIVDTFADMEESTDEWRAKEDERQQAETVRQENEVERQTAEDDRLQNENDRVSEELNRVEAEKARADAEKMRVLAENDRKALQNLCEDWERKREQAEDSRVQAEATRVSAENARNVFETYDSTKAYQPGNKVAFEGASYLCVKACRSTPPPDTAYWLLIAQKGRDGTGIGDMLAATYDPNGKTQDVFAYAAKQAQNAQTAAQTYTKEQIAENKKYVDNTAEAIKTYTDRAIQSAIQDTWEASY